MITDPRPNFNGSLAKMSPKLGFGWLIISYTEQLFICGIPNVVLGSSWLILVLRPANERRRYKRNTVSGWPGANLKSALQIMLHLAFPGYDKIDETKMDPPQKEKFVKLHSQPWRGKEKQQSQGNGTTIATLGASNMKDGATTDADSDYEYVSNPMKTHNRSTIHKWSDNPVNIQQNQQNTERNNTCEVSSHKDCSYRGKEGSDGYMKLIRETMEPAYQNHEYQRLNKDTMDPPLALSQIGQRGSGKQHYTIWTQGEYDLGSIQTDWRSVFVAHMKILLKWYSFLFHTPK